MRRTTRPSIFPPLSLVVCGPGGVHQPVEFRLVHLPTRPEQVLITNGAQHAIALCAGLYPILSYLKARLEKE